MNLRRFLLPCAMFCASGLSAQKLLVGTEFQTFFDNREYAHCDNQPSGTVFSAQIMPWIGVQWMKCNRLVAGVCAKKDFGLSEKFADGTDLMFYYEFRDKGWTAQIGVFDRALMLGEPNDMIYDEQHRYTDDHLMGAHVLYTGKHGFAEAAVDWEGQPSEHTREKFRVLSNAQYKTAHFYAGYDMSMLHLALDATGDPDQGVVDHIQTLPYIGVRFSAYFDFDLRGTGVYSLQRDRHTATTFHQAGGMFRASMSRWGLTLAHQVYAGDNQQVFREQFGELLYSGSPMYGTSHNLYNKTTLRYHRPFFEGTVYTDVAFVFHHDGSGLGTEQLLTVGVDLERAIRIGHKKKH